MHRALLLAAIAILAACTTPISDEPADPFMANLNELCGQTHEGRLVTTDPADADFAGKKLVMGPVACNGSEVQIPFAVSENRTRTWVITRTAVGVRLKHIHRHDDGTEDKVSRYGGDTASAGTDTRQEFPADEFSKLIFRANKLDRSVDNVWAVEAAPGKHFAYELRRPNRFFRVEFPLTK
jgi:hypothetical protein